MGCEAEEHARSSGQASELSVGKVPLYLLGLYHE
jgi:hypothetical protein